MKNNILTLFKCIIVPLTVGVLAAFLTRGGMESFKMINKPVLTPPGWVFPVVWTILYVLMGIASYLVLTSGGSRPCKREALVVYGIQLAVNFFWPILFFNLELYLFAFLWLALLWFLILACILLFGRLSVKASRLMIPYLIWVTFAGYLNFSIYLLN